MGLDFKMQLPLKITFRKKDVKQDWNAKNMKEDINLTSLYPIWPVKLRLKTKNIEAPGCKTQIKTKHLKMVALEQQSAEETALHLVEKHKGLLELTTGRSAIIDIKGMGVLDPKAFTNACKGKF
uniref:Uncharacterized protein n=1 Tax=Aegilops tauschii TaxID=37682 RepID=R7W040_AEGTA